MQLFLEFESVPSLRRAIDENLGRGWAFVPGKWLLGPSTACELVLIHPETQAWLPLAARTETSDGIEEGVVVALLDSPARLSWVLHSFLAGGGAEETPLVPLLEATVHSPPVEPIDFETAILEFEEEATSALLLEPVDEGDVASSRVRRGESVLPLPERGEPLGDEQSDLVASELHGELGGDLQRDSTSDEFFDGAFDEEPDDEPRSSGGESLSDDQSAPSSRARVPSVFERLRGLNAGQRERVARSPSLQERRTLERIYGAAVWEALLGNPLLTGPEVARIAKNGAAPTPIIALIVSNSTWLAKPEIRRALLTNPRLRGAHLERVLRALPKTELRQVPRQTAYPAQVRAAAARMIPR